MSNGAVLVMMCGLPGTGKSSVAEVVADALVAPVFSVDPLETAMIQAGLSPSYETGLAAYKVVESLVESQLSLNRSAVVDAVNGLRFVREVWFELAHRFDAAIAVLHTYCSDVHVHENRFVGRKRDLEGFVDPTWAEVLDGMVAFEPIEGDHLSLDAIDPLDGNASKAVAYVEAMRR